MYPACVVCALASGERGITMKKIAFVIQYLDMIRYSLIVLIMLAISTHEPIPTHSAS
jgi:hypothetical protein